MLASTCSSWIEVVDITFEFGGGGGGDGFPTEVQTLRVALHCTQKHLLK